MPRIVRNLPRGGALIDDCRATASHTVIGQVAQNMLSIASVAVVSPAEAAFGLRWIKATSVAL